MTKTHNEVYKGMPECIYAHKHTQWGEGGEPNLTTEIWSTGKQHKLQKQSSFQQFIKVFKLILPTTEQ